MRPGRDGHREHRGAGDDQPLRDRVGRARHALGQVRRVEDVAPGGEAAEGRAPGARPRCREWRRSSGDLGAADYVRPDSSTIQVRGRRAARIIASGGSPVRSCRNGSSRRLRDPRRPRRRRARRADGRRLAADLPDGDLRPGRGRAPARRLRVRAEPEPDARAARAGGRRPRERAPRDRLRLGLRGDGGDRPARGGRPGGRRRRRRVRRHVPLPRAGPQVSGAAVAKYADLAAGPDELWEQLTAATRLVWFETPSNPLLKVSDIAQVAATIRERAAQPGGAAAAARRRQHVRLAGAPAPARARRRHRVPLRDQVPGRALRHDPRRRGHPLRRGRGAAALPPERDGRRARAVRLLPRPARAADAGDPGRAALGERARGRPVPGDARRRRRGAATRASPRARTRTPGRPSRRARCGSATMPAFGGMVSFLPAAGGRHGRSAGERAIAIAECTRLFTLAESLGGVESLIEVPAAMTHLSVAGSALEVGSRRSSGSPSASRRVDDLIADLAQALDGARSPRGDPRAAATASDLPREPLPVPATRMRLNPRRPCATLSTDAGDAEIATSTAEADSLGLVPGHARPVELDVGRFGARRRRTEVQSPIVPTTDRRAARRADGIRRPAGRPRQPLRRRAVRGARSRRRGDDRRRGLARRPHRQAHRPLAAGQVRRPRAVEPGQGLVGRRQPRDQRGELRPPPRPPDGATSQDRRLYAQDLYIGAHEGHRRSLRVYTETAWASIFARNLFRIPPREALATFQPNFTIIDVPTFEADPATEGTRTGTAILRPPQADGDHHRRDEVRRRDQEVRVHGDELPDARRGRAADAQLDQRRRARATRASSSASAGPGRRRCRPTRCGA